MSSMVDGFEEVGSLGLGGLIGLLTWESCVSGADPGSVCVAMVIEETGRDEDDDDDGEGPQDEEGRRTCSWVFSLITSS